MDGLQHLRRLFDYDDWANREALASLRSAMSPPTRALKVLAHVLGAERLWLDRLEESKKPAPVWPDLTLERCHAEAEELQRHWRDYLDDLEPADLDRAIAYTNTKGEPWSNTVGDILTHVALHSVYHRGQIASDLRAAGHEPASTDFIHAVRQGFLE
jgi:uncharacterized damage-inducible protein DinB